MIICLSMGFACAETNLSDCSIASGTIASTDFEDLVSPCSGVLESFDLNIGDRIHAGEPLFRIRVTTITAPEDGTVESVFIEPGQKAEQAMSLYGSVCTIRPSLQQRINCTYATGDIKEENKQVYAGETLYFRSARGDRMEGSGVVIGTDITGYTVQILTESFEKNESLDLYRNDDYSGKSKVGNGKVQNRGSILIPAAGTIASVLVKPGQNVKAGDPLLTVLGQDAEVGASPVISAEADGIVAQVSVLPCQQIWKGALLCRIWHTDKLEVQADVDEMDLHGLAVGDKLSITLDTEPENILTGTVTEISGLGISRQNASYYTIHVALDQTGMLIGQSASVYLPRE